MIPYSKQVNIFKFSQVIGSRAIGKMSPPGIWKLTVKVFSGSKAFIEPAAVLNNDSNFSEESRSLWLICTNIFVKRSRISEVSFESAQSVLSIDSRVDIGFIPL